MMPNLPNKRPRQIPVDLETATADLSRSFFDKVSRQRREAAPVPAHLQDTPEYRALVAEQAAGETVVGPNGSDEWVILWPNTGHGIGWYGDLHRLHIGPVAGEALCRNAHPIDSHVWPCMYRLSTNGRAVMIGTETVYSRGWKVRHSDLTADILGVA